MRSFSSGWLDAIALLDQAPDPLASFEASIAYRAYLARAIELVEADQAHSRP